MPATNPEYFTALQTDNVEGPSEDLTSEALHCLANIERMSAKEKGKSKGGFLKRLFSNRRNSGSESDILKTPKTPTDNKFIFDSVATESSVTSGAPPSTPQTPSYKFGNRPPSPRIGSTPRRSSRRRQNSGSISKSDSISRPSTPSLHNNGKPSRQASSKINSPSKPPSGLPRGNPTRVSQRNTNTTRTADVSAKDEHQKQSEVLPETKGCAPTTGLPGVPLQRDTSGFPPRGGVPGMEPPRPVLHQVCGGFYPKDIPNAVIIYSSVCSISEQWMNHCSNILSVSSEARVYGQPVEEIGQGLGQRVGTRICEERIYHADIQIIIISPSFLDWVERYNLNIGRLLHPPKLLGLMLGVLDTDLSPVHVNNIRNFVDWKVVDLKNEAENEEVTLEITKLSSNLGKEQKVDSFREPEFDIFPRKVNPGQNKILFILDSPKDRVESVEVIFSYGGRNLIVDEYKIVKENILKIEAPESLMATSSMATVKLYIDSKYLGELKLKLESSLTLLEGAWKHQTSPLKIFSQAFGEKFSSMGELDNFLASTISQRNASQNFDKTLGKSCETLLHFAAHHGLFHVADTLLNLGWERQLLIQDVNGMNPKEIAQRAGHSELASLLSSRMEPAHEYHYPNLKTVTAQEESSLGLDGYLIPNQTKSSETAATGIISPSSVWCQNGAQMNPNPVNRPEKVRLTATSQEYITSGVLPDESFLPTMALNGTEGPTEMVINIENIQASLFPIEEKSPEADSKPVSPESDTKTENGSHESIDNVRAFQFNNVYDVPRPACDRLELPLPSSNQNSSRSEISHDEYEVPPSPRPVVGRPHSKSLSGGSLRPDGLQQHIYQTVPDDNYQQRKKSVPYITMTPSTRKSNSISLTSPNSTPFQIPKSGSFSGFSDRNSSQSMKYINQSSLPRHPSRQELIQTYCINNVGQLERPSTAPPPTRAFTPVEGAGSGSNLSPGQSEESVATRRVQPLVASDVKQDEDDVMVPEWHSSPTKELEDGNVGMFERNPNRRSAFRSYSEQRDFRPFPDLDTPLSTGDVSVELEIDIGATVHPCGIVSLPNIETQLEIDDELTRIFAGAADKSGAEISKEKGKVKNFWKSISPAKFGTGSRRNSLKSKKKCSSENLQVPEVEVGRPEENEILQRKFSLDSYKPLGMFAFIVKDSQGPESSKTSDSGPYLSGRDDTLLNVMNLPRKNTLVDKQVEPPVVVPPKLLKTPSFPPTMKGHLYDIPRKLVPLSGRQLQRRSAEDPVSIQHNPPAGAQLYRKSMDFHKDVGHSEEQGSPMTWDRSLPNLPQRLEDTTDPCLPTLPAKLHRTQVRNSESSTSQLPAQQIKGSSTGQLPSQQIRGSSTGQLPVQQVGGSCSANTSSAQNEALASQKAVKNHNLGSYENVKVVPIKRI